MPNYTDIAVSPSGSTLLNAVAVSTTAGNPVLNEVVTLGDASSNHVGSVLASGAQLVEPGGVNTQPVSGALQILDGGGGGYKATVYDIVAGNLPPTDTLPIGIFGAAGEGPVDVVVRGSFPTPAIAAAAVMLYDPTSGQAISGDGNGNLNVSIANVITGTQIPVLPSAYTTSLGTQASTALTSLQCDFCGSVFTKPFRRSQTIPRGTTWTGTAAATIMAAQGASNFCDLTQLIVSAVPGATGTEFVATLSDGTASYLFDMNTGATTSLFIPPRLEINFNPALPATNANVPWTLSLSQSVTAHATVIGVLQQAS